MGRGGVAPRPTPARIDVLLSGLMVTRPATPWPLVAAAIGDFAAEAYRERELVVVHDGDAAFDARLAKCCAELDLAATLERVQPGQPLGALRNRSVALARSGAKVARVRGIGWSYVYRFHGGNAFDFAHHAAAAVAKSLAPARLAARERTLRERLAEYRPALPAMTFPAHSATIELAPASAGR